MAKVLLSCGDVSLVNWILRPNVKKDDGSFMQVLEIHGVMLDEEGKPLLDLVEKQQMMVRAVVVMAEGASPLPVDDAIALLGGPLARKKVKHWLRKFAFEKADVGTDPGAEPME